MKSRPTAIALLTLLFGVAAVTRLSTMSEAVAAPDPIARDAFDAVRFTEFDQWEAELQAREQDLITRRGALDTLAAVPARPQQSESDADKAARAKRMAAIIGTMSSQDGASTLEALSIADAAAVLAAMRPDMAGPILAAMPGERSADIARALMDAAGEQSIR